MSTETEKKQQTAESGRCYAQYTTPTRRNCRDASCHQCEHTRRQSWPSLQFPKWWHTDVIVEKVIEIHEYYTTQADLNVHKRAVSFVMSYPTSIALAANWVTADGCVHIAESVGSRCELVANSCTHRQCQRDATRQFHCVGIGDVYWALGC